jgi:hypothetical protein
MTLKPSSLISCSHNSILLRADSGFARDELMAWCEAHGVHFLFGLQQNERLVAACGGHLRKRRPLKIQRKNSGSGNKCLRAIGTTTRSLRSWVRSAKNLI